MNCFFLREVASIAYLITGFLFIEVISENKSVVRKLSYLFIFEIIRLVIVQSNRKEIKLFWFNTILKYVVYFSDFVFLFE